MDSMMQVTRKQDDLLRSFMQCAILLLGLAEEHVDAQCKTINPCKYIERRIQIDIGETRKENRVRVPFYY